MIESTLPLLWFIDESFMEKSKFLRADAAKIEYFSARLAVYDASFEVSDCCCCCCCCNRFISVKSVGYPIFVPSGNSMSSMSAYLMAGLKSLLAILTTCALPLGIEIGDAGMVMVVVVNGVSGVVIIGAIADISRIFVAFALIAGITPASTSTAVFSSTFFSPEYLMRGWDLETVVNSNWYDCEVLAPTVKLAGVVSSDDDSGVAVWKILDGTSV